MYSPVNFAKFLRTPSVAASAYAQPNLEVKSTCHIFALLLLQ